MEMEMEMETEMKVECAAHAHTDPPPLLPKHTLTQSITPHFFVYVKYTQDTIHDLDDYKLSEPTLVSFADANLESSTLHRPPPFFFVLSNTPIHLHHPFPGSEARSTSVKART